MSPLESSPEEIIQAASMTPSFIGAYKSAPPSIRVGDKTYERDAARNSSERVWYLAACAMQNPRAVYLVGNQGVVEMALAYDESEVESDSKVVSAKAQLDAARKKVEAADADAATARNDRDTAKSGAANVQQQIDAQDAQVKDLEARIADMGRVKDFGDGALALLTSGLSKGIPYADLQVRLSSAKNHVAQLRTDLSKYGVAPAESKLKDAEKRLKSAKADVKKAESNVTSAEDAARQRLRKSEEDARIEAQRAKDEALAEAATEDARRRQQEADDAWNQYYASGGGSESTGGYYGEPGDGYYEPEWQSTDWASTDPDTDLGYTEYLDEPTLEEMADLYGDEDEARKMAWLTGEPIVGVNTRVSPYSIDGYYENFDLETDEVFGNDTAAIVGGIIAGVLAAAPAIIGAVAPPPSKDATSADTNVGAGKLGEPGEQGKMPAAPSSSSSTFNIDTFLEKIGLKKTINDAASAAGGSAGKQGGDSVSGTVTGYLVIAGLIGAAVWIAKS